MLSEDKSQISVQGVYPVSYMQLKDGDLTERNGE